MQQKIKDMNHVNNTRGRESVRVTLEQIQTINSLKIIDKKDRCDDLYEYLGIILFIKLIPTSLADKCAEMIMKHGLITYHSRYLKKEKQQYNEYLLRHRLICAVIETTSIPISTKFINYVVKEAEMADQYGDLKDSCNRSVLLYTLCGYFSNLTKGEVTKDVEATSYVTKHRMQMKQLIQK